MDLQKIQALIKFVAKAGVDEVELETDEFKISIKSPSIAKKKTGQKGEAQIIQTPVAVPQVQPVVQQQQQPQQAQQATQPQQAESEPKEPAKAEAESEDTSKYIEIKSPMIGTFYRSPSPDKPMFVNVGDTVKPGDVLCIIEAMKLFNEIESEVSGKVVKVLVDDATPVEYDQPLLLVDPA